MARGMLESDIDVARVVFSSWFVELTSPVLSESRSVGAVGMWFLLDFSSVKNRCD